jgi:uncharacterized protein YndB with AHSA1/START domain
MTTAGKLQVAARGDREILMTREFQAARPLVWDAYTKPELMKRWLGVRGGWTMPVCEVDLRVGGRYRYVWRHEESGMEMGMGGAYLEVSAPAKLVCTEKFDTAWYPGGCIVSMTLEEKEGRTILNTSLLYDTAEARDGVLRSPMETGVAESYDNLEQLLAG